MNPFLDDSFHVPWSKLTPERVVPDMTLALEKAESEMQAIRSLSPEEIDFRNVPLRFCKAQEDLGEAWNLVSHLDQVRNSEELREAYNEMLPKVTAFGTKALLDQTLWKQAACNSRQNRGGTLRPRQSWRRLLRRRREEPRRRLS